MKERYTPIIVSVYDRLDHFKRCVKALQVNKFASKSVLYIISDASYIEEHEKRIQEIREYISSIKGFKEIIPIIREKNLGAHISINTGIEEVLKTNDTFIFLEDDIVVASNFLEYMNNGLSFYENDKKCFSICGFNMPFELSSDYNKEIYFYPCNSPWGFATWKDRWDKVNRDYSDRYSELKKNKSDYKRFLSIGFYVKGILQADSKKEITAGDLRIYYHMFQNKMYSVFPIKSKSQNWGFDGTGEHCGDSNAWWTKPKLDKTNAPVIFEPFDGFNQKILKNHQKFQDKINGGILAKYLKYTWVHQLWKKLKKRFG